MKINQLLTQKETVRGPTVIVNLERLSAATLPDDDIRRCVAKALKTYPLSQLPSMIESLGSLEGIMPSSKNIIACLAVINGYVKANRDAKHPVHQIDNMVQVDDVVVTSTGVEFQGKSIPSRMGMICADPLSIMMGATATVLNYYTKETKGDIDVTFNNAKFTEFAQIPKIDLINVRSAIMTNVSSPTISRDAIYSMMYEKKMSALAIIDQTYAKIPGYNVYNETVKTALMNEKKKKRIGFDPTGMTPGVMNPDIKIDESRLSYTTAWTIVQISRSLRGGDKAGVGSLTSGYYLFDMPPSYAKAIARSKELLFLTKAFGVNVVQITASTSDYSLLVFSILVANGISVVTDIGYKVHLKDSVAGIYGRTNVPTLRVIPNVFAEPSFAKTGISMNQADFSARTEVFAEEFAQGIRVMYTYYTSNLQEWADKHKFLIHPSASPHSGRVLLVSQPLQSVIPLTPTAHLMRIVKAVYCRNLYPLTRKPYVTMDPYRAYFSERLVVPKVIRSEKKGMEMDLFCVSPVKDNDAMPLDLSGYDFTEAVPVKVNHRQELFRTIRVHYDSIGDEFARHQFIGDIINAGGEEADILKALAEEDTGLMRDWQVVQSFMQPIVTTDAPPVPARSAPPTLTLDNNENDDDEEVDLGKLNLITTQINANKPT